MDSAVLDGASSSPNDKIFPESADEVRARNDEFRAFFLRFSYGEECPFGATATQKTGAMEPLGQGPYTLLK